MTNANVNISDLHHYQFDDNHTLLYGEISTTVKKAESIHIPGNINCNTHIVLAKSDSDYLFKTTMDNSPVINDYDITLYDHSSTAIAKYLKDRKNNKYGSTKSMLSSVKFISEIKLPSIPKEDTIYLVIDNYNALDDVLLEESVKTLVKKDFTNFIKNNNHLERNQICLFIKTNIHDKIKTYVDLNTMFEKIIPRSNVVGSLIEYLMGKNISCSDISYQTNLTIIEDVDILSANITANCNSNLIGRSNHTLQLNVYSDSTKFNFVSLLKHEKKLENLNIVTTNDKQIKSTEVYENIVDNDLYERWVTLKDNILFHVELENNIAKNSLIDFLEKNTDKVVYYLFNPDINLKKSINIIEYSNSKFVKSIINLLDAERKEIDIKSQFIHQLPHKGYYNEPVLGRQHSIARIHYTEDYD